MDAERAPAEKLTVKKERKPRIEKFYKPREVAEMLRRHVDYIYDLIREKKLDAQPVGGRYLIPESALQAYLESERMRVS